MTDFAESIFLDFWATVAEMSPYLLFGFFVAGLLSVLISQRFVETHLGGRGIWPLLKASILGVPLPLCSCGVIPVSVSLHKHGASKGSTIAFLLSTPQTGVDSIFVTLSLLGPIFAVFRPLAALVTGVLGGSLVDVFDKTAKTPASRSKNVKMNAAPLNRAAKKSPEALNTASSPCPMISERPCCSDWLSPPSSLHSYPITTSLKSSAQASFQWSL